jgi:hypothetical protein
MAVVLFALAVCMSATAVVLSTGANPGVRLTIWRTPPNDPVSVKVARGVAVGLALFGSISLSDHAAWWWGPLLIMAVLMLPFSFLQLLRRTGELTQTRH